MKKLFIGFFILNVCVILGYWGKSLFAFPPTDLGSILVSLGRLTGLLAVYFVLLQFILMGRARWLEEVVGLDKLSKFHRLNGYLSLSFVILHPLFIVWGYSFSGKISFFQQFRMLLTNRDIFQALIAVCLFILIVFSSIYIVRNKLAYEWWHTVHLLTYVAVILAWGHQLEYGSDFVTNPSFVMYWYTLYFFVFSNLIVFRFLVPIYLFFRHQFVVTKVVPETDSVNSVYISGKDIEKLKIVPGQFVIVRFLSKEFWWEAHPFSVSAPVKDNQLRVTIKQVGDFTRKVDTLGVGTKVFVEGPYGTFTEKVAQNQKIFLVAGGIGITPIRAMIESMADKDKDIILVYANRCEAEVVFKKELEILAKKYDFPLIYIMSQQEKFKGEKGRLNQEKIKRLVPDITKRDVYVCGSASMTKSVIHDVKQLGVTADKIHFEIFSL